MIRLRRRDSFDTTSTSGVACGGVRRHRDPRHLGLQWGPFDGYGDLIGEFSWYRRLNSRAMGHRGIIQGLQDVDLGDHLVRVGLSRNRNPSWKCRRVSTFRANAPP